MMQAAQELIDLTCKIASELSNCPAEVRVELGSSENESINLVIFCKYVDIGFILGKAGRNINALRTIVSSVAAKKRVKVNICLKEA